MEPALEQTRPARTPASGGCQSCSHVLKEPTTDKRHKAKLSDASYLTRHLCDQQLQRNLLFHPALLDG